MTHVIEPAATGRSKCRGCGRAIEKGRLRLGERLPNPFAEGREMTLWYHLQCGAYKRPEVLLEATDLDADPPLGPGVEQAEALRRDARLGTEHRRLPRVDGGGRAPSGRARCRACRELIEKDTWRVGLVFYEEGQFNPSGYIHAACSRDYLGTDAIVARVRHFSPELTAEDAKAFERALAG